MLPRNNPSVAIGIINCLENLDTSHPPKVHILLEYMGKGITNVQNPSTPNAH